MKPGAKSKSRSSANQVREVATKYRTATASPRQPAKCRMLTGEELGKLVEQMIAAKDAHDAPLLRRLKRQFTNGFYGEIRA
jgi:hypothetical protein